MAGLLITAITSTGFAFFIIISVFVLSVVLSLFYKNDNKTAVLTGLLCLGAGVLSYMVAYEINVEPVRSLENQTININATVVQQPYMSGNRYYYIVETTKVTPVNKNINCPQQIRLKLSATDNNGGEIIGAEKYDNLQLTVKLSAPKKSVYNLHNISQGYYINADITEGNISVTEANNKPWYSCFDDIKKSITKNVKSYLEDDKADLLVALLLGDKSQLNNDVEKQFREAGVSHIIVVSGLHLSIIVSLVFFFVDMLFREKKISAVITIFVIVFYMCITGFSYSVMRSGIMNIIYMLSFFVYRKPQAVNSLGFAGLVITLLNPLSIGNLSLLMSFTSTLGIVTLGNILINNFNKKLPMCFLEGKWKFAGITVKYVVECVIVSLVATAFTLPVMVFVFKQFSLYFIISNLLITSIAPLTIMCGCMLVVTSYIPIVNLIAPVIGFILNLLCTFMLQVTFEVSKLPFAVICIDDIFVKITVVAVIITVAIFFVVQGFQIKNVYICTAVSTAVAGMVLSLAVLIMANSLCIQVINTGTGVTIIDKGLTGVNVISCGGGQRYLSSAVDNLKNYRINSLLIPGSAGYYSEYAENILQEFEVENVLVCNDNNYSQELEDVIENSDSTYISNTSTIKYADYTVDLFSCDNMQWIYIDCSDGSILVSPKNADCSLLPKDYTKCDIFIVQKGCTNLNAVTTNRVIYCGANNNGVTSTSMGDVTIYKFPDKRFYLWQS